ncbi:MAG: HD domain-containing protein [Actinomycetota bacterium]|nr:HD domain-containing protein [Actinomycetota bacterium]
MSEVVDQIVEVLRERGDEAYLGERVSMLEHMLQAAHTAQQEGAPDALVVAALVHDIGHLVHDASAGSDMVQLESVDRVHEEVGAAWLARGFGPEVTEPVRLHVAAKRYLCATERDYFAALSPASVHTLSLQGGPMSPAEAADFIALPHADAAVALRRFDDAGKRLAGGTPSLEHFLPLLLAAARD